MLVKDGARCCQGDTLMTIKGSSASILPGEQVALNSACRLTGIATKAQASHMMAVEIEVDRLDQLAKVLMVGGASVVLLDNMNNDMLREAVAMVDGQMKT